MSSTATTSGAEAASRKRRANSAIAVVQAAGLPAQLGDLVLAVTGKCRLWRSERVEVARELCAHFLDGLETGTTPASLAASFGDPRHSAKLITATRKRLRPLWWRTSRAAMRGAGAFLLLCLVIYAVLAARFFLVSPRVNRNIMNELNTPILRTAVSERAWPLYIEARKQFGPFPDFMVNANGHEAAAPGEEGWDEMAAWLEAHAAALDTVRTAATKPVLGYVYRASMDPDLARAIEATAPGYKYDPEAESNPENPLVVGILLPHLGEMRKFARWLRTDARLAATKNDSDRFLSDVEALLGMAGQAMQDRFVISELVAMAIADLAAAVAAAEATRPEFLSREQLRDLAHKLSGFNGGRVSIDVSCELLGIEDVLQRFFSDDGHGDGHYVGGPEMDRLYQEWGVRRPNGLPFVKAVQPVQSAIMSTRAEIMDKARRFAGIAATDDALPPWRHDERGADKAYDEVMQSGLFTIVPFLEALRGGTDQGPIGSAMASRDILEARRDAVVAVLAMETFRRTHGAWPTSLRELVPAYLPGVPVDPFDGKPMRYVAPKSAAELPLLYSVGADGIDEGGRVPATEGGRFGVHNLYWLGKFRAHPQMTGAEQQNMDASRGDWVLWPEPPPVVKPDLPDTNTENVQLR